MYNAKNEELQPNPVKAGQIYQGVIIDIQDKTVKEFVKAEYLTGWRSDINQTAINCTIECKIDNQAINTTKLFTYTDENGKVVYKEGSNLGKYKKTYAKLPEVGDQVNMKGTSDGFLELVL